MYSSSKHDISRYLDQNTNTSGGIYIAQSQIFGGNGNRAAVSDVILTLTDGEPSANYDADLYEWNYEYMM